MRRKLGAALAAVVLVSACGGPAPDAPPGISGREAAVLGAMGRAQTLFTGGAREELNTRRAGPEGFTPEAVAADPASYRLIQVNALAVNELGRIVQVNGDEVTVALQSGPTAAFDQGVLTATRGFGDDLQAIDAPGLLAVLRAGGGTITRTMETLDGQDQVHTAQFSCTVTAAGTERISLGVREVTAPRLNENCRSAALIFDNIYWLDGSGDILASRQYVSPTVAYLRANGL